MGALGSWCLRAAVRPEECFNAASKGEIEAFMGSTVQWPAKDAALPWFTTVPFGMNPHGMLAWFYQGDGFKLWEETYAAYNLVPRPGPEVAPQMAGWFRKKITSIGDFKGFKMRIPGLGGKVLAKAGATTVTIPAADIYPSLERGVIDAAEFVGPHDDMKLGLHKTAPVLLLPRLARARRRDRVHFQQEGLRVAPGRSAADPRSCRGGGPSLRLHELQHEERDRAPAPKDRVQGQDRGASATTSSASGPQDLLQRGPQGGVGEESHGAEGSRVLYEISGACGSLGPHSRRRLPSTCRRVTPLPSRINGLPSCAASPSRPQCWGERTRSSSSLLDQRGHLLQSAVLC